MFVVSCATCLPGLKTGRAVESKEFFVKGSSEWYNVLTGVSPRMIPFQGQQQSS